jgi:hypothetical protein
MRRILALIIAFSLLAVTSLPASVLPCCCKVRGTVTPVKAQANGDDAGMVIPQQGSCCKPSVPVCCAATALAGDGCCAPRESVKSPCPACRCLEHLQTKGLCNPAVQETSADLGWMARTADASRYLDYLPDNASRNSAPNIPPPQHPLTQKCVLTC